MTQLNLGKNKAGVEIINSSNFGDTAKKIIDLYFSTAKINKWGKKEIITSSKIRGILEMVNIIYNSVLFNTGSELTESQLSDIAYLNTRLAYECREEIVKKFIDSTCIMKPIKDIVNSKKKDDFLLYCRYAESLIAYFKYNGG